MAKSRLAWRILRFAIQVWHDSGAYQIMSSAHAVLAALLFSWDATNQPPP